MNPTRVNISPVPVFESVTGLTNTTIDAENLVPGRGATEGQIAALHTALADAQARIDEIEAADDGALASVWERLQNLNEQIDACCTVDHGEAALDAIWAKLEALEAQIEECCQKCSGGGGAGNCDGNAITVSFAWNGANPFAAGGQATAVSAMSDHSIVGFFFLAHNPNTGLYYRSPTAYGGDWTWSINASGNVTAAAVGGSPPPFSGTIVAVDDHGCEGTIAVSLPSGNAG